MRVAEVQLTETALLPKRFTQSATEKKGDTHRHRESAALPTRK